MSRWKLVNAFRNLSWNNQLIEGIYQGKMPGRNHDGKQGKSRVSLGDLGQDNFLCNFAGNGQPIVSQDLGRGKQVSQGWFLEIPIQKSIIFQNHLEHQP